MARQPTPIPTLTPEKLLEAAQRTDNIEALRTLGEACFKPYADAISSGEYKQSYIKNLPGRQGYTAVFQQLNEKGLTQDVNSLDGERHILQQCHYEACYPQETVIMDQPTYDQTAKQVRELFAPVIEPGEQIKVFRGQTVELNDGGIIGKPQNRLSVETVKVITDVLHDKDLPKGNIQYSNDSQERRKVSSIEVLAVRKDPETGEKSTRTLLRQERDFVVSANLLADLQLKSESLSAEEIPGTDELPTDLESEVITDELTTDLEPEVITDELTTDLEPEVATDELPTDLESEVITDELTTDLESEVATGETVEESAPIAFQPTATRQPQTYSFSPGSINNTLSTLEAKVGQLPPSNTKELWQRINTDLQILGQQGKQLTDNVKAIPTAISTDAKTSIAEGWKKLETLKNTVQTRLEQTTTADLKSRAIADIGIVADAGSRQLGKMATYLQKRAVMAKNYGMAKSALKVFETGHSRTGESAYQAGNYKIEAKGTSYAVYNEKNQPIISFEANRQGKPIPTTITKEPTATENDNNALNQLAKAKVVIGSEKGERDYQQRLQSIITGTKNVVPPNQAIPGEVFHIERDEENGLTISTQASPHRELIVDSTGKIESSSLIQQDLNHLDISIEKSVEQQSTQPVAIEAKVEEKEQITV